MKDGRLTLRQEKFVLEYLVSGNASNAALKAGYKAKAAYASGAENLKKPQIRARIDAELKKIASAKIADATEVLQLLTSAARGEMDEQVVSFTPQGELEIVAKKVGGREKVRSLELLGKHYKLYTEGAPSGGGAQIVIDFGGIDNDESDDKDTGE